MDVLIVAAYPSRDEPAAARFVADQAAALRRAGVRPWVATFDRLHLAGDARLRDRQEAAIRRLRAAAFAGDAASRPGAFRLVDGIPVARLAVANGPDRAGDGASSAHRRAEALRDLVDSTAGRRWDLVHAHMGYPDGAAAAEAAKALGVPLVITEHASFVGTYLGDEAKGLAYRAAIGAAERVVAVSEMLRAELAASLPETANRLRVIPNAVAVDEFPLTSPAARDADELLYVGYRKTTKGIAMLLEAMALVHARRPRVRLRMIGSAPSEAEERGWQQLVAALDLQDVVSLEPTAERPAVAAAMARAALLVQPSPRETFGIVVAEALASGMPVVAVDSGGVTEIMSPDPSALGGLVPDDRDAFAEAILATLDRRATLDPARLRAHVVERYASAAVARRVIELYREVCPAARSDPAAAAAPQPHDALRQPAIVVGIQRPILDRIRPSVSEALPGGTVIVTSGDPAPGLAIAAVQPKVVTALARWGTAGTQVAGPRFRRLVARLAQPALRAYRRRRYTGAVLGATRRAAAEAAAQCPPSEQAPRPLAVCLGGLDALAVEPLVAAGILRAAPGGLRWLADGQPEPTSTTMA